MTGRSMTEHSTTEQRRPSGRQAPRNQDTPIPLAQSPLNDAAHNIQGRIRPRRQGRPTPNCRPTAPAHWPTAAPATASRPPPSAAIRDALHSRFFSLKNESGKMSPEKHGRTQWATQLQTTTILPDLFHWEPGLNWALVRFSAGPLHHPTQSFQQTPVSGAEPSLATAAAAIFPQPASESTRSAKTLSCQHRCDSTSGSSLPARTQSQFGL